MRKQKAFSVLQLLIAVAIILFIAGIAVPNLLRSFMATNEASAVGSLPTINIAGIPFSYRYQNIGFAILGTLVGAATALAAAPSASRPKSTNFKATVLSATESGWVGLSS